MLGDVVLNGPALVRFAERVCALGVQASHPNFGDPPAPTVCEHCGAIEANGEAHGPRCPHGVEVRYWLCCGSQDPSHRDRSCMEAKMGHPERCRFGTAAEHSEWQRTRGVPGNVKGGE